jgi:hypothetical protein
MSWGFACGNGWYDIIYRLCERIEPLVASLDDGGAACEELQVKEKFGGLRFYVDGSSDEIEAVIHSACELSRQTCEVCGNPAALDQEADGWRKTLCPPCRTSLQTAGVNRPRRGNRK